jgi:WD repeat-containing protein 59
VWNLNLHSKSAIDFVLNGHIRAITDVNWGANSPETLATCALDGYVHCWDMRTPQYPVVSFVDWDAGALQVKWNRIDENIIASTHDRTLHIWDRRKGVKPLKSIVAHERSIRGLDWNRTRRTGVVTCSLDKTVKFWDYAARGDDPERVLRTNTPVWRARHTPFGWGLMTMPKRGDTSLYLWDRRAQGDEGAEPITIFSGHKSLVQEFLWRSKGGEDSQGNDARQFQLVTCSEDHQVKLWPLKEEALVTLGHERDKPIRFRLSRRGAEYKTFRGEPPSNVELERFSALNPPLATFTAKQATRTAYWKRKAMGMGYMTSAVSKKPNALREEEGRTSASDWMKGVQIEPESPPTVDVLTTASLWNAESLGTELVQVSAKFPAVEFESVNIAERKCTLSLSGPWGADDDTAFVRLHLFFPDAYPESRPPVFEVEDTSGLSADRRREMEKFLGRIGALYARRARPCVESCLRYLVGEKAASSRWRVRREGDSDNETDTEATSLDDSMIMSTNLSVVNE